MTLENEQWPGREKSCVQMLTLTHLYPTIGSFTAWASLEQGTEKRKLVCKGPVQLWFLNVWLILMNGEQNVNYSGGGDPFCRVLELKETLRASLSWVKTFYGYIHTMQKFPGQGSNPCHNGDLSHSSDNAGSLTHWAIRELPVKLFDWGFMFSFS